MAKLRYLGHSAFYIEGAGLKALIDPFLSGNPNAAAKPSDFSELDAIFLTHGHGDHIGDTIEIAKRTGACVFSCSETASWLAQKGIKTEGLHIGGRAKFPFGSVKLTPAWHGNQIIDGGAARYGGIACGFVIEVEGKKIYHAGDTGLTVEMQLLEAEKIDTACLPIGGRYTMDIEDAVRAVGFVRPVRAVPMHYDTFPVIKADPYEFASAVKEARLYGTEVVVLAYGDTLEI
ncbi:MAG: metal-dependent hydrolase [Synergistes sp.]|nr:metal-dependent hydrolase [Synergistes sp.]